MTGNADVPTHDLDEGGIALGGPNGDHVADKPEEKTCQPKAQAEAKDVYQFCPSYTRAKLSTGDSDVVLNVTGA